MNEQQEAARQALKIVTRPRKCAECGRAFDLFDEIDAAEWAYGHDCEPKDAPDCTEDDGGGSWWSI